MTLLVERACLTAGEQRLSYLHVRGAPADAPVVVLLHGLASDAETWDRILVPLARRGLRPLALDLVGHGQSEPAEHDYLLTDFATSVVAAMDELGVHAATVVGHSLGGAIAMTIADRHPDRCERLVLAAAGGLGREVHAVLRAASLPVAPTVLRAITRPRLLRLYARPALHRALRLTPDNVTNLRRAGRALGTPERQAAFFAALRAVIEPRGQRGSFITMGLLAAGRPTLVIWSEGDPVIPVAHARAAADHLPGSRLVVLPGGGHEPHRRQPERVAEEVAAFIRESPELPTE